MESIRDEERIVVGVLSGTSADGIDCAICRICAERVSCVYSCTYGFSSTLRQRILTASSSPESVDIRETCRLHRDIGEEFGECVRRCLLEAGIHPGDVYVVGSHGQTMWHETLVAEDSCQRSIVRTHSSLQLGDPEWILQHSGCSCIVSNFRAADIAVGGAGAPLMARLDVDFFAPSNGFDNVVALQNIGGIGNVSFVSRISETSDESLLLSSFDTGPGNCWMDVAASILTSGELKYDQDGILASQGVSFDETFEIRSSYSQSISRSCSEKQHIAEELLEKFFDEDSFFRTQPPKSSGREYFSACRCEQLVSEWKDRHEFSPEDILSMLLEISVRSICFAYDDFLPVDKCLEAVVLSGGGARNREFVRRLKVRLMKFRNRIPISNHNPEILVLSVEEYLELRSGQLNASKISSPKTVVRPRLLQGVNTENKESVLFAYLAWLRVHGFPANVLEATGANKPALLGSITGCYHFVHE